MVDGNVRAHRRCRWSWTCMGTALIAAIAACDPEGIVDEAERVRRQPPPADDRSRDDGPCEGDRAEYYGCPGMPCAHGWCAEGACVGELHGRDGTIIDPGVCCVDHDCLAGGENDGR